MAAAEAPAVLILDAIQQVILVDAGIDGDIDAIVAQDLRRVEFVQLGEDGVDLGLRGATSL